MLIQCNVSCSVLADDDHCGWVPPQSQGMVAVPKSCRCNITNLLSSPIKEGYRLRLKNTEILPAKWKLLNLVEIVSVVREKFTCLCLVGEDLIEFEFSLFWLKLVSFLT